VTVEKTRVLEKTLNGYFSAFESTDALVNELIEKRKNPVEALILICARLDALASDSVREGTPSKRAFTQFLSSYGGHHDLLESVSLSNLYYELSHHAWLLEGIVSSPGRLHTFGRNNLPVIQLLEDADLPLTLADSQRLLATLMRILKAEFRVVLH